MINKNLKIALFSFAALFILSIIYLLFAFILKIWPFNNEDFSRVKRAVAARAAATMVADIKRVSRSAPSGCKPEYIHYNKRLLPRGGVNNPESCTNDCQRFELNCNGDICTDRCMPKNS